MNEETPINVTTNEQLSPQVEAAPAEAPVETAPVEEAAPVEEVDLLSGIGYNEPEPEQFDDDPFGLIRDYAREGAEEAINKYRKPQPTEETDKTAALEAKMEALERKLANQEQQSILQAQAAQSQKVISTYVANVNTALYNANITPDTEPMLFRALNSELTAAVSIAERQLGRVLLPKEAAKLVGNFNKQWEPILAEKGIGKARNNTAQPSLSSVGTASFGTQPGKKVDPGADMKAKLDAASTAEEMIALMYGKR